MPRQVRLDALPHCVRNLRPAPRSTSSSAGLRAGGFVTTMPTRRHVLAPLSGARHAGPRARDEARPFAGADCPSLGRPDYGDI